MEKTKKIDIKDKSQKLKILTPSLVRGTEGAVKHRVQTQKLSKGILLFVFCILYFMFFVLDLSLAGEKQEAEGSIIITSKMLTIDNRANTALFEGSVVAEKGNMTLFADKMLVHYSDRDEGGNIKKIDAEGNVKLIEEERTVTSDFATYFAEPAEKIIFTGQPKASEGENVITGTKITYFVGEERSIVENGRVFLKNRQ